MNDDINDYMPSLLNPREVKKQDGDISLTQNSYVSRRSLSLRRNSGLQLRSKPKVPAKNKENSPLLRNLLNNNITHSSTKKHCDNSLNKNLLKNKKVIDKDSIGTSAINDLDTIGDFNKDTDLIDDLTIIQTKAADAISIVSVSSNTELNANQSDTTVVYDLKNKPTITVSFGINNCQSVDINSKKSSFKKVVVTNNGSNTQVDCEVIENSNVSTMSEYDNTNAELVNANSLKRPAVTVNLEIKKKKTSGLSAEEKVLILNSSANEEISHVIVQPPNYKIVQEKHLGASKFNKEPLPYTNNGKVRERLKQKSIDSFFPKRVNGGLNVLKIKVSDALRDSFAQVENTRKNVEVMSSKFSGINDGGKSDRSRKSPVRGLRYEPSGVSSPVPRVSPSRGTHSATGHAMRKPTDSIQFHLPPNSVSAKKSVSNKVIPQFKIIAGTRFAVDAFSYGDIPNVTHYFLTHFHSDHYSGLKRSFSKFLYCSKITGDLCVSRLGVNANCIQILNLDETVMIDDVEVTTVEANHCPGAVMLVFTLPTGRSLLHTGDFRASPAMESYPVFWNKDIHTIYLDTTYCNPKYDFPTQDESLEMALHILRQKKMALEKSGKKFSSVLIVCGTYTIGKEKFFLGVSRRVGCGVWACPEKERVLRAVQPRAPPAPPALCQLHVVPMRDLTHEKLRAYLESLKGAFSEVVAFKPSGWENSKTASVERDCVTIHGIPYSEHSSFSELVRFVKYLHPSQIIPTVDISGGAKAVQKYFPCPLVYKDEEHSQSKVTDFFSIQTPRRPAAVT